MIARRIESHGEGNEDGMQTSSPTHAVPPPEFAELLRKAPLRVAISVPVDLMEDWFAPNAGMKPLSRDAIEAAQAFARLYEWEFKYDADCLEGVFWKWVPAL
jgi:hypothetical protein